MIRAGAFVLACLAGAAQGADCRQERFAGNAYSICEIDLTRERLELFLNGPDGKPYGHFGSLDRALHRNGLKLGFAMNAGMYHQDRAPVGYYLEQGEELQGVISSRGPGNFGMLPNGIFCIGEGRADVIETGRLLREAPECRSATQSGPMLVIDGALHPRFIASSDSLNIRNGVGTSADGRRAVFAIANEPVNFHHFARLFRDRLELPNALYLDGRVSRLFAPELGRNDFGLPMGPMVGVVAD